MVAKRQGKQWTKKEDKLLKEMFLNCFSYKEMGKELDRSWFACKCRLARLGLIQPFRNTENMVVLADLNMCRDFLEQEIKIVNNMKKITVEEREKVCRRLC